MDHEIDEAGLAKSLARLMNVYVCVFVLHYLYLFCSSFVFHVPDKLQWRELETVSIMMYLTISGFVRRFLSFTNHRAKNKGVQGRAKQRFV